MIGVMEEVKKLLARQRIEYGAFWGVALLLVILFEAGALPSGVYAGNVRVEYVLETAGILAAIVLIPLSLKLFSVALVKRVRELPLLEALKSYRRWSDLRLLMLGVVVYGNLVIYYLTMRDIGSMCALMGLAASLFCWPGLKRIKDELELSDE